MECVICYETITENNKCNLVCGHVFHTTCAMKFARMKDTCPLCRESIGAGINKNVPKKILRMPFPFDMQTFEILKSLHNLEQNNLISNERWHQVKNLITGGNDLAE